MPDSRLYQPHRRIPERRAFHDGQFHQPLHGVLFANPVALHDKPLGHADQVSRTQSMLQVRAKSVGPLGRLRMLQEDRGLGHEQLQDSPSTGIKRPGCI